MSLQFIRPLIIGYGVLIPDAGGDPYATRAADADLISVF